MFEDTKDVYNQEPNIEGQTIQCRKQKEQNDKQYYATFNSISVISWRSVLLVDETGEPQKTIELSQVHWIGILYI
jgi:hypothetical protein